MKKITLIFILLVFYKQNAQENNPKSVIIQKINEKEFNSKKNKATNLIEYDSIKFPKKNNELNLKLLNGKFFKLKDNLGVPYDENRISYKYLGRIDVLKKYLVEINAYEESSYLLVDFSTGKQEKVKAIPIISKSRKYFITSYYNQYEEYNDVSPPTQDINIYVVQKNSVLKKIISKYYKFYTTDIFWNTDNEIYIKTSKNIDSNESNFKKIILK